ncbi:MAG: RNA polymerase, sigma-24 subunit, ECF subfamily [Candidatus Levybacteria bacterium GW2011_GWA2_37_36]|nr:MAG: RNA polymerase, sigma-24 subunit, ECF subfamily [Candidatus Levybacteria bacterium GW2011_GWA2_37_36]KKS01674.1 MAG: RNA polymerase, sigma-24 subunit, ECF subfamily [Candidatus Curtissbacteria bacterium GW2011_GWC2_41_21]KKU34793.1 MAG: RNA polymerase, sigma-24 subunit, ECF subfamily [Candidatus Beckwithbacteria bacterium GW2011_GWA1_46_30]
MQKPPFDEVVKNYIRLVYFFARKSLYQQEDVDDIVQETFLKAMKNYKQFNFKSEGELKSWLLTICRHLIADQMRSKKKTVSIEQNNIELFDNSDVEDMMDAEITHEKDIERVKRELLKLKPEEQEIIRLRIVEEMEFKEIAVALDTKEAAVKMRFYRAIIKLKEALI